MIPRGTSRWGELDSSAAVATMSKPRKAKNTTDAAVKTPMTPKTFGVSPASDWSTLASAPGSAAARRGGTE